MQNLHPKGLKPAEYPSIDSDELPKLKILLSSIKRLDMVLVIIPKIPKKYSTQSEGRKI